MRWRSGTGVLPKTRDWAGGSSLTSTPLQGNFKKLLLATSWPYSFMGSCGLLEAEQKCRLGTRISHITMEDEINYWPKFFSLLHTHVLCHSKSEVLSTKGSILLQPLTSGSAMHFVLASGLLVDVMKAGAYLLVLLSPHWKESYPE